LVGEEAASLMNSYAQAVVEKKITASKLVRLACERHRRDILRDDLVFHLEEVGSWLAFTRTLQHVDGNAAERGELFDPLPWQVFCIGSILGWYHPDGRRRYRLALIEVARGNGKTTLCAALALWATLHGTGRENYLFANTLRQAQKAYRTAAYMARGLAPDELPHARGERRKWRDRDFTLTTQTILDAGNRCMLAAIPAKENSLDGLSPHIYIADEAACYDSRAVIKLTTATVKRTDSAGIMVTTPGATDLNVYGDFRREQVAVLQGEIEAPGTFAFLAGIDDDDDPSDTTTWVKANPSMGQTVYLPDLKERWASDRAKGPRYEMDFTRFHLCRFVGDSSSWLGSVDAWDACKVDEMPNLEGARAVIGIDLSKSRDMSSVACLIQNGSHAYALCWHLYPEECARERERELMMPILKWGMESVVTLCEGRVIDYQMVLDYIDTLCERYQVKRIYNDPYCMSGMEQDMEARGLPIFALPQRIQELSPGTLKIEALIASGKLQHNGDPCLRMACQNAMAFTDITGNVRLDKKRSAGLIDPAMALCIAGRAWVDEELEGSDVCPLI
jgi:phage terminase large subunit-like protein